MKVSCFAFPLLLVGASLALVQPCAGLSVEFQETGSLALARYNFTLTALPDGKALAAGGFAEDVGYATSAELYDPATGMWAATGSLNIGREGQTATLLLNGKVLIAAGSQLDVLASAEL